MRLAQSASVRLAQNVVASGRSQRPSCHSSPRGQQWPLESTSFAAHVGVVAVGTFVGTARAGVVPLLTGSSAAAEGLALDGGGAALEVGAVASVLVVSGSTIPSGIPLAELVVPDAVIAPDDAAPRGSESWVDAT